MNTLVTHDQKRAKFAWEKVEEAATVDIEKYRNLAKAVASLIMNSGLMQTLAFLQAKDEHHHRILKIHICKWLGRTLEGVPAGSNRFPSEANAGYDPIMKAFYEGSSDLYLRATSETMSLLRWIRQFADARYSMGERS
jgi:CRISPR-associated protein Cmr5